MIVPRVLRHVTHDPVLILFSPLPNSCLDPAGHHRQEEGHQEVSGRNLRQRKDNGGPTRE